MKRKRISLLCAILSVTMVILLCPPIAFAEDAIPDAKMLSYEDYFENEHGFYLDTITKSKQYLNMSTGLFSPLVQKEANGTITRNGQEVTGIIGNSEIVFFAIDHTVYRYHVKSKRIDAVFTEPMMESFYPITSHVVLWTKASTPANAKGLCTDCVSDNSLTDSNLNHTGIYLYSKGKIMIHLTFDYKTDEKCTTPGQYLKYHRTFQGLSTRELAEKVGIVPATLVLYENDRHPIKHSTAVALANALGIDRNRLLDKYTAFVDYPYSSLLKKVRQDLSLTQIQMAELIGIGQTSYSGWEREIRVPRRKEYDKILAALEKLRVNVDTYLCQSASI